MKSLSVFLAAFFILMGSASAIAMMRAPGSEVSPAQQKSQHEIKKHPDDKTQASPKQHNYPSVPLSVPVKQNR